MSALGHKRTFGEVETMSTLPPKADIGTQSRNVRSVFFEMFDETQLNSPLEPDNDHECRLRPHALIGALSMATMLPLTFWPSGLALPQSTLTRLMPYPMEHSERSVFHPTRYRPH